MRYDVRCRDASGNETLVSVHADTDEQACAAALRILNSWLAVTALPATVELPARMPCPEPAPEPTPTPVVVEQTEEVIEIGRIVHKGTVVDWIGTRIGRVPEGAAADAFRAARERVAA